MTQTTDVATLGRMINAIVESVHAPALVDAYFQEGSGFAGAMFDGLDAGGLLGRNEQNRFTGDDIAAASLLDVRFGPVAVQELLGSKDISDALEAVPPGIPLWAGSSEVLDRANTLWQRVIRLPGVGGTRTSKLLARKRPNLVPVVDSVIIAALRLQADIWRPLQVVLRDQVLRSRIDALRPTGVNPGISTLRLLDVAVWMTCSRSTAAVKVQSSVGAPTTRDL